MFSARTALSFTICPQASLTVHKLWAAVLGTFSTNNTAVRQLAEVVDQFLAIFALVALLFLLD